MRPLDPADHDDWRPWLTPEPAAPRPAVKAAGGMAGSDGRVATGDMPRPAPDAVQDMQAGRMPAAQGQTQAPVRQPAAHPAARGFAPSPLAPEPAPAAERADHAAARPVGSRPSLHSVSYRRPLPGTPPLRATPLPDAPQTRVYDRRGAGQDAKARAGGGWTWFLPRRKATATARDAAPSRASYRMQRLWLTPGFRGFLRFGLPLVLVAALVGGWFAGAERRDAATGFVLDVQRAVQERPEFMVQTLSIAGASPELRAAVQARMQGRLPTSSFDLDLDALRRGIEQIDAVARAELRLLNGGVLEVRLTERQPVIVWRSPAGLELLDATGARVALLGARGARPDLPLIAGEGAQGHLAEAMALFDAAAPLEGRLRGLVRVGERRWDVVLDRDQRILLPENDAVAALERVIAQEQAQDILSRDLMVVDLRLPERPTIRLAPEAMSELRRIRGVEMGITTGVVGQ